MGYYIQNADEWWECVFNAGYRGVINQLSSYEHDKFKAEHLNEINALSSDKGIWMEVPVLYTVGEK